MAMLNFGGQQTVSTSVQNFVRMTLRRRSSVCSMPPRLQVLRPPIQPNHRLVNPRACTDPAGWHDLAQCWREIRGPPALPGAFAYSVTSPAWASGACQSPSGVSAAFTRHPFRAGLTASRRRSRASPCRICGRAFRRSASVQRRPSGRRRNGRRHRTSSLAIRHWPW
jgi:hypothetical protein